MWRRENICELVTPGKKWGKKKNVPTKWVLSKRGRCKTSHPDVIQIQWEWVHFGGGGGRVETPGRTQSGKGAGATSGTAHRKTEKLENRSLREKLAYSIAQRQKNNPDEKRPRTGKAKN